MRKANAEIFQKRKVHSRNSSFRVYFFLSDMFNNILSEKEKKNYQVLVTEGGGCGNELF